MGRIYDPHNENRSGYSNQLSISVAFAMAYGLIDLMNYFIVS